MDTTSTFDAPSGCPMDILTDDALIVIFSFLSLYERITLMRVNQRWKTLLSNPQTWTHLDFWQEQKTNKNWETEENDLYRKIVLKLDSRTWLFPVNEEAVLDFLKKYTCASLKSLYLRIISDEIIAHVKESYRNLEKISFLSAHRPPHLAFVSGTLPWHQETSHNLEYDVPWLPNIKVCEFPLDIVSCRECIEMQQRKLLSFLRECCHLRRLTITGLEPRYLTPDSLDGLSQDITEVNFVNVEVERRFGPVTDGSQLCNSLKSLLKIANMNTFRISTRNHSNTTYKYSTDEFLYGIADKWHELKCLSLRGIESPSKELFSAILSGLSQLEQLELYEGLATDDNIALIAEHLINLISLNLTDGTYTSSGIKSLCGHPSIEKLNLLERGPERTTNSEWWLMAVYDVIRSLSTITSIRLVGYRLTGATHGKVFC